MDVEKIKEAIKAAFEEGYDSYATACFAYNTVDEAWEEARPRRFMTASVQKRTREEYGILG